MKKGFKTYTLAWLILLALFNVIAFVSPGWAGIGKYTGSFWVGYALITACFLGNLLCAGKAFRAENARKLFYNMPLITLSYTALIVSFVIGGLCMLLSLLPYRLGAILCAAVLALYAIAVVKAQAAAEIVEGVDERVKTQTSFIRDMTAQAESLMRRAEDPEAKAACKKVYEALRYSDPVSAASLEGIEDRISSMFQQLSAAVLTGKNEDAERYAALLTEALDERAVLCKAGKQNQGE